VTKAKKEENGVEEGEKHRERKVLGAEV